MGGDEVGVAHVPPFMFALERSVALAILLTGASLALRLRFPQGRRVRAAAVAAGVAQTALPWAVIGWSVQFVPTGLASVFGSTAPVWTAVLAHFFVRGDRLTVAKIAALALGLLGTTVLVGASASVGDDEGLVATALLAALPIPLAVAAILQARMLRDVSPLPAVAVGAWVSIPVLIPFALTQVDQPQDWSWPAIGAFAYLVIVASAIGLSLSLWLYRSLRPTTMMLNQVLLPAVAVIVGVFAFGESVTPTMLGGTAMVVAAVLVNALFGARGGTPDHPRAAATPAD